MRIALVVPPFIPVPPERYGGTELFVAHLAEGLQARGHHPVVYTVGESKVACETRWQRKKGVWPIESPLESSLDDLDHASWACHDAGETCDVIHLNNAPGLSLARFLPCPVVYTLHHPYEPSLSRYYARLRDVQYVAISRFQARRERLPKLEVIHHGLDLDGYRVAEGKRDYACFLGRITPDKGVTAAIRVARAAGVPLKLAGQIQPLFHDYWQREVKPEVDGRDVEYVGELDLEGKNELLAGARALLFPIQWDEPFGLVMIEAMACGVPVLAFARGSAPEVVVDGESGWLCRDEADMSARLAGIDIAPAACRRHVARHFSCARMVESYIDLYERTLSGLCTSGLASTSAS